jgi:Ca-activated chloride channel family protein
MEARALLVRPKLPDTTAWLGMALLRPVAVFAGFGVLLIILWFGVPRLIWPERYEPQEVALRPDRWVAETQFKESPRGRKPPAGFGKSATTFRGASDKTVFRPRTDFDGTRTRLD